MKNQLLEEIGFKVIKSFLANDFESISKEFEYSLKQGRETTHAIKEDFINATNECIGELTGSSSEVKVITLEENTIGLDKLIECYINLEKSSGILIELILTTKGSIYLEDINSYGVNYDA